MPDLLGLEHDSIAVLGSCSSIRLNNLTIRISMCLIYIVSDRLTIAFVAFS